MGSNGRGGLSRFVAVVVFAILVVVAIAGFAITRNSAQDEEAQLLTERASEVAAILSTSGALASSMNTIGEVYASGPQSGPAFAAGAKSLVGGVVTAVGVAELAGDQMTVRAVEGVGLKVGDVVAGRAGRTASSVVDRQGTRVGADSWR